MTLPNKMPHDYLSGRDGGGTLQRLRVQFVSSAGASAMAALLLTPLDVIKTRMQTSLNCGGAVAQDSKGVCSYFPKYNGVGRECLRIPLEEQLCYLCCKPLTPAGVPRSDTVKWRQRPLSTTSALCIAHCKRSNRLVNVVKEIVQYEGVKALWRGTGPSLFMAIPSVGIYLTSYDHAKVYLQEQRFSLATASVIAGAGARGLAATITAPLELVRTRLQADGGMRGHGVHAECERAARRATGWLTIATKAMVEKGGIRALWQGLGPTLWRDVPFSALYWLVAERTKEYLLSRGDMPELGIEPMSDTLRANLFAGVVGGMVASLATHPFDVIKTRSQVEAAGRSQQPTGTFAIGRLMVQELGAGALWNGVVPRLMKVAPSCAIVLASYEALKQLMS